MQSSTWFFARFLLFFSPSNLLEDALSQFRLKKKILLILVKNLDLSLVAGSLYAACISIVNLND